MVNWQVTAATIYCDAVDDDVTVMVYKDWTTQCLGYAKYHKPVKEIKKLLEEKGGKLSRKLECEGPECRRVIQYREKLVAEEAQKGNDKLSG